MTEWKQRTRGQAEELVYYFKNHAMHEANMHEILITTTVRQGKDADNIPYEELIIRIPFTNNRE